MEINLDKLNPDIRKLSGMKEVLFDKNLVNSDQDFDLYYMYRGVEEKDGLRYDITVVPAKMLGKEFVKTKGHYHLENWQEVYTVLEGEAIYLMQKRAENGEINDAYFVKANKGESIIIPPLYGHVTINPSKTEQLKMANWVSPNCKVDYKPYEENQGACYYYLDSGWQKNENYANIPELRQEMALKFVPQNLDFLK